MIGCATRQQASRFAVTVTVTSWSPVAAVGVAVEGLRADGPVAGAPCDFVRRLVPGVSSLRGAQGAPGGPLVGADLVAAGADLPALGGGDFGAVGVAQDVGLTGAPNRPASRDASTAARVHTAEVWCLRSPTTSRW